MRGFEKFKEELQREEKIKKLILKNIGMSL